MIRSGLKSIPWGILMDERMSATADVRGDRCIIAE